MPVICPIVKKCKEKIEQRNRWHEVLPHGGIVPIELSEETTCQHLFEDNRCSFAPFPDYLRCPAFSEWFWKIAARGQALKLPKTNVGSGERKDK